MPKNTRGSSKDAFFVRVLGIVLLSALPPADSVSLFPANASAQEVRARTLGVPFEGRPGPLNAITDVAGVAVGHTTLIAGEGPRIVGEGPVRTGVTAVVPRLPDPTVPVFAAWFALNGNGEMTGTTWIEDSNLLEGPIMITNTLSVGIVHHAVIRWGVERAREAGEPLAPWVAGLPVVAETWDGALNDIYGQHVSEEDAIRAIEGAQPGAVLEGNVGGGSGMICHQFKGGIGTSSRVVQIAGGEYTVGVLVQCNYGDRDGLQIAGVPVGREISDLLPSLPQMSGDSRPVTNSDNRPSMTGGIHPSKSRYASARQIQDPGSDPMGERDGSIIVVVATDAPVLPQQLKRMARRVSMGLGRMGSVSSNSSGDIFVAFTTANQEAAQGGGLSRLTTIPNRAVTPLFRATIQATEEAVVNALVAAETMTGADSLTVPALPHDRLQRVLRKYNRLVTEDVGGSLR